MLIFIRNKAYKHWWHVVLWTDKKKIILASFDNQLIGATFITNHMYMNWDVEYL